jgi:hypothetical protein
VTLFLNGYPPALGESKSFNSFERELIMSTESVPVRTTIKQDDPNRIVTITLKASEAYILRYITAILADTNTDKEERKSLVKHSGATPEDMTRIHHKIYGAEMGWDSNWNG